MTSASFSKLDPVVKTISVPCTVTEAFQFFTAGIHQWWPLGGFSVSAERRSGKAELCAFEPRVGGRIYERSDNGEEYEWGRVLEWNPPQSLRFTWYPARTAETAQEIEVTFAEEDAQTRITLMHSGWEKLGERAQTAREQYRKGWDTVFGECYGNFARAEQEKRQRGMTVESSVL